MWGYIKMNIVKKVVRKIMITPLEKIVYKFYKLIYSVDPNLIVFETEGDYWDNGRVFYEYLVENGYNDKYKIVWFVHEPEKYKKQKNVEFVSRFGYGINFKAQKVLAQGHCFLFTHPWWFINRREGQVVINLTHSTMQLKAGGSIDVSNSFDYILCASEEAKKIKRITYHAKEQQMIILGMPRNDLLFKKVNINKLIEKYNGEKIVMSMVTFKQSYNNVDSRKSDLYSLNVVNTESEMNELNTFLKQNDIILVIKIHHLQDISFLRRGQYTNIYYFQDSDLEKSDIQLYELLGHSDALLTDYSSVFYDYLFVNRPIGFLIDDLSNYERGFCVENPLEAMPGPKIYNVEQLMSFMKNVINGEDDYKQVRENMLNEVHYYKRNHCERLLHWLEDNVFTQ